jgi:hypothetical protein
MKNRQFIVSLLPLLCLLALQIRAAEPISTAWFVNPTSAQRPASLARIRPEVHSVTTTDCHIEIRSAGLSLHDLGALQAPPDHVERMRQLRFRIPRFPAPVTTHHLSVRPDVVGVFLNGVPIYNQFEAQSYQGQNLWHFDPLARNGAGAYQLQLGLLAQLIADGSRHSPLLGFAFDGYPIYGPWGFVSGKNPGGMRRMRSSYRLRGNISRNRWADGTTLTPAQHGPPINDEYPLGTFVEDYEYDAGSGDLDEFNGRFAFTPEYPQGTYAYFLTTDEQGRLAFPYLLAGRYYGEVKEDELRVAFIDEAAPVVLGQDGSLSHSNALASLKDERLELSLSGNRLAAHQPLKLTFTAKANDGKPIRHLEFVHERPLHLLIVSEDLKEFAHIHPMLTAGDRYEATYAFPHGGRYRLYADYTPPGSAQRIARFVLDVYDTGSVSGLSLHKASIHPKASTTKAPVADALRVVLTHAQPLHANTEIEFALTIRDPQTQQPVTDLEPFLGAWAHFVIIDEMHESFIHAHPLESTLNAASHTHDAMSLGPPPAIIRTLTSFPRAGKYKLWAQFQRNGAIITQPFTLHVDGAPPSSKPAAALPSDALKLNVSARGFAPATLTVTPGHAVKLAITRDQSPNCANKIAFPALGLSFNLPLGQTTVIELPALPNGELGFSCGMGMYKGVLLAH